MSDLSTLEGQAAHYAAVKQRLGAPRAPVKPIRYIPPPITPPLPLVGPSEPIPATVPVWRRVLIEVARKHGLAVADLTGPRRARKIVAARQEAYYRMRTETMLSLLQIGQRLGGKDHTTVLYGIRRYEAITGGAPTRKTHGARREPVWGVGGWH